MTEPRSPEPTPPEGQVIIYRDGALNLRVRLDGRTVWLTQRMMAELYQMSGKTVNEHLVNIYAEEGLEPEATIRKFRIVQMEGNRKVTRTLDHYNLDAILAVGYRVRSHRGTQFRQWATSRLSELLVKGFTLDDERIKAGRTIGQDYFDELLERVRDIRASEGLFYQKITDIYSTSVDYDPRVEISQTFFATVQNKLHWAIHGHTAAEIVAGRADAAKPHMGLTTWKNAPDGPIRKDAYRGVHFSDSPFFLIDTAFYVQPKTQIEMRWAFYEILRQDVNGMDSGSAIPSTSREDFDRLPALEPPFQIQQRFVELLNPLWVLQEHNEKESHTLAAIRDALLPKLLSGEIRVRDAERIVGENVS